MLFGLIQDFEPELFFLVAAGWFIGSSVAGSLGEVTGIFLGMWVGLIGK